MVTCHTVRHDATIRVSDQVDPFSIKRESLSDFLNQSAQVAGVIWVLPIDIATGIGSIPKAIAVPVDRAVREAVEETSLFCQRRQSDAILITRSIAAIAVQ